MAVSPVLREAQVKFQNILYATDLSEASSHALPFAAEIARTFGSALYLCHVISPHGLGAADVEAAGYLCEMDRKQAEEELANLLNSRELQGLKGKMILTSGPVKDVLLDTIRENEIDLVVAGTHGRTGMRKLVLGSFVAEMCRLVPCPILTVGPDVNLRNEVGFRRILFPTSFSSESKQILPYLALIAAKYRSSVRVLHVAHKDHNSNIEPRVLAEQVHQQIAHLIEGYLEIVPAESAIESERAVEAILNVARQDNSDIIMMSIKNVPISMIQLPSSMAYRTMVGAPCPVLTLSRSAGS